jgi:hypothetical protein
MGFSSVVASLERLAPGNLGGSAPGNNEGNLVTVFLLEE